MDAGNVLTVKIATEHDTEMEIPKYATTLSSGFDICARIDDPITIYPAHAMNTNPVRKIPTGLRFNIPPGYEIQIRSRSGLTLNHGIIVANAPGTIDADYNLEVSVLLMNVGIEPFVVQPGMKIAQGVLCPVARANFCLVSQEVIAANQHDRIGGFGSTGI